MPMTATEVMNLIQRLAYELGLQYGIKDLNAFSEALVGVASYESSFDPGIIGDNGHSVGLFQLHDQGAGAGMTVAQRQDAETNIRKAISYLGPIFANSEAQGLTFDQSVKAMVAQGQRPADPQKGYERAMAFIQDHVWGGQQAGTTQAAGGNAVVAWMMTTYGFSKEDAELYFEDNPTTWSNQYRQAQETTTGAEWQTPEAREAARLGNIETELGLGLAGYGISNEEYDRQRGYYADQVEAGSLTVDQAVNKFNAWLNATQEAGRRAEYVHGVKEERAKRTLPSENFPLTEPGGMLATVAGRYNLPFTPLRGTPVSAMPSPEAAYEQYRTQMGISAQAPEIPTVAAPTVPTPPAGGSKAREFVDALLRRRGVQTAVLGGLT